MIDWHNPDLELAFIRRAKCKNWKSCDPLHLWKQSEKSSLESHWRTCYQSNREGTLRRWSSFFIRTANLSFCFVSIEIYPAQLAPYESQKMRLKKLIPQLSCSNKTSVWAILSTTAFCNSRILRQGVCWVHTCGRKLGFETLSRRAELHLSK